MTNNIIRGKIYIVGDDIDTDQIIPAIHLVYSIKDPEQKKNYGKYAMSGLPKEEYPVPFVEEEAFESQFSIILAGENFGCGSSREQAPGALQITGVKAVIAKSYARIFYRNAIDGAFLYPLEYKALDGFEIQTGDEVVVDMAKNTLTHAKSGKILNLQDLGDALAILEAGGIFEYARKHGVS